MPKLSTKGFMEPTPQLVGYEHEKVLKFCVSTFNAVIEILSGQALSGIASVKNSLCVRTRLLNSSCVSAQFKGTNNNFIYGFTGFGLS